MRNLLSTIGTPGFEPAVLSYLDLSISADRIAVGWLERGEAPDIRTFGDDVAYARWVVRALQAAGEPPLMEVLKRGTTCSAASAHLHAVGLVEELRFTVPLKDGRRFIAFLGRAGGSAPWNITGKVSALGGFELLRSIIALHDRCISGPEQREVVAMPSEDKLVRALADKGLTRRESEVASKVLLGYSTLAISLELGISDHTVKVHRKHLNQKLGVRSQAELFGFAFKALMAGEPL